MRDWSVSHSQKGIKESAQASDNNERKCGLSALLFEIIKPLRCSLYPRRPRGWANNGTWYRTATKRTNKRNKKKGPEKALGKIEAPYKYWKSETSFYSSPFFFYCVWASILWTNLCPTFGLGHVSPQFNSMAAFLLYYTITPRHGWGPLLFYCSPLTLIWPFRRFCEKEIFSPWFLVCCCCCLTRPPNWF